MRTGATIALLCLMCSACGDEQGTRTTTDVASKPAPSSSRSPRAAVATYQDTTLTRRLREQTGLGMQGTVTYDHLSEGTSDRARRRLNERFSRRREDMPLEAGGARQ